MSATARPAASTTSPSSQPALVLRGLVKHYGDVPAVAGVDLEVHRGEFLTLLGPSGSGKTTTLRMIAGFTLQTAGTIEIDGVDMSRVPPYRRDVGMVFQNYALFPHMTAAENIAFPLQMRRLGRSEIRRRVADALALVKLAGHGDRYPRQLSGGQQQRIALARAVVFQPRLLLMDEPLGALDKKLREALQLEIMHISHELGATVIYVTHDQEEAMAISDRIVLMNHGRIEQEGLPFEIRERPRTPFAAGFLGSINWFDGVVAARKPGAVMVVIDDAEGLTLTCTTEKDYPVGTPLRGGVRPEQVRLRPLGDGGSAASRKGAIRDATYLGTKVEALVEVGKLTLQAAVPPEEWLMDAAACKGCLVELDQVRVHLFPQDSPALVEDV